MKPEWSARAMMLCIEATGDRGNREKRTKLWVAGSLEDRDFSLLLLGEFRAALPLPPSIPPTVA